MFAIIPEGTPGLVPMTNNTTNGTSSLSKSHIHYVLLLLSAPFYNRNVENITVYGETTPVLLRTTIQVMKRTNK